MAGEDAEWAAVVSGYKGAGEVNYEPVGGINPADGPVALCVGGSNRLTGELAPEFWGACCDADEQEVGKMFRKSVVPTAVLTKAHMPDLAKVIGAFNVESIESRPNEFVKSRVSRKKVEFESLEFNQRFLATVPDGYDPMALRELFSPGFLDWTTTIDRECDFGINDRQFWFLWRLKERTEAELKLALANAGELFKRLHAEMDEEGFHTYPPGPWNAGLEPFPGA
ncbi:MAG TPA: hypothetical protein VMF31_04560 [Solirubrobacterales bacterium]|nr:hypothetical protein [Solirubrobacterales bacterium]